MTVEPPEDRARKIVSSILKATQRDASQTAIAAAMGVSESTVSRLLSDHLDKLALVPTDLLAVVTDRADGKAVGFISFRLKWILDAFPKVKGGVELEVELDQAWIDPAFRRRGWGELAAIAITSTMERHLDHVHSTARWRLPFLPRLKVCVCADIYSTSGEALLTKCADYVALEFGFSSKLQQWEVSQILLDERW